MMTPREHWHPDDLGRRAKSTMLNARGLKAEKGRKAQPVQTVTFDGGDDDGPPWRSDPDDPDQ